MPFSSPPDLESTHEVLCREGVTVVVRRDWRAHLPVDELLSGAALEAWGRPVLDHGLVGRARLHVLDTPGGQLVAKELSRGGLLGSCLPDVSWDRWRPAREAALAERLSALGVPTATVAAARSMRVTPGLYRCDIATVRLGGAVDLLAALTDAPADRWCPLAGALGRTLGRLHDVGLVHRDMQVKNLLAPGDLAADDLLAVIDLDGCRLTQTLNSEARLKALTRFARSLVKRGILPGGGGKAVVLPRAALGAFFSAYVRDHDGPWVRRRAELLRELSRRLGRQLAFHRLFWRR